MEVISSMLHIGSHEMILSVVIIGLQRGRRSDYNEKAC